MVFSETQARGIWIPLQENQTLHTQTAMSSDVPHIRGRPGAVLHGTITPSVAYGHNCLITALHARSGTSMARSEKTSHAQSSLQAFSPSVIVNDGDRSFKFDTGLDL